MRNKLLMALFFVPFLILAQQSISLNDMSAWKQVGGTNWRIAGDVSADISKRYNLAPTEGTGVLVNIPNQQNKSNLLSVAEYGDVDVSFDFMMASHSNSGFYLMGRYEIQLLDSWGVKTPKTGDCGGIYKRRRYENGKEILWEGHAPRQNACLAPGLWQHMDISFQAPRFDASGKKIANAKVLKIMMNGTTLHENIELTGATGGPISEQEAAKGPFMIQGDHGPVAFKNFKVTNFDGDAPSMSNAQFKIYYGAFKNPSEFLSKTPDSTGTLTQLNWNVSREVNNFAQIFTGIIKTPKAGRYTITLQGSGNNSMKIAGKEIMPDALKYPSNKRIVPVDLGAGDNPFEIIVYKTLGSLQPILGLWISEANTRPVAFHNFSSTILGTPRDPILLDAKEYTVFRSFMDVVREGKNKRIVHAISVGSPDKLHYTMDMDNGSLAQIWKGEFLNTSPMWDDRGDGSSKPLGTLLTFNNAANIVNDNAKSILKDSLPADANYRTLGYEVDDNGSPIFRYQIFGAEVRDSVKNTEGGKYLTRSLSVKNGNSTLSARLAIAKNIEAVSDYLYAVDGKSYFIKILNNVKGKVEKIGENSILTAPLGEKLQYEILW
jgi:hypothetical protein